MRILHYSLGLPPYRTGGLTKYATDLMSAQNTSGDIMSLLYPGDYTFWKIPEMRIVNDMSYKGIRVYEIKNPSIVPLLHGVQTPDDIYNPKRHLSGKALDLFYNEVQPEVMHIHTLMGLPMELVVYLKEKGVRIVFTSHDYYGLCPKVNFINQKGGFCASPSGFNCAVCNKNSPGSLFLRIRNSKFILKHKEKIASIPVALKAEKNKEYKEYYPPENRVQEYTDLLTYYIELFNLIDCFHFNSTVSEEIYTQYYTPPQSVVIPISHSGIKDFRKIKTFDKNHIKLGFIGSIADYKGFPMLKQVLTGLEEKGIINWSLQVWGGAMGLDTESKRIRYKGKFTPNEIAKVYEDIDFLIVPSIWKETFSLITLEALAHGVPVLVTTNVGAKDIIKEYNQDFIIEPTKSALHTKLMSVLSNPSLLADYTEKINSESFNFDIETHIQKIKELYLSVLKS